MDDAMFDEDLLLADDEEELLTEFSSVFEFVDTHLVYMYARDLRGGVRRWCAHWWWHPEVLSRLEALWRAYEHLRTDPGTGMSVWWRDHADPAMAAILDPGGPFDGCSVDGGHHPEVQPLPIAVADEDDLRVRNAMSAPASEHH